MSSHRIQQLDSASAQANKAAEVQKGIAKTRVNSQSHIGQGTNFLSQRSRHLESQGSSEPEERKT